ncbi:MAG: hypothetical protein ACRDJ5_09495 [Actinomycetota bacterium]
MLPVLDVAPPVTMWGAKEIAIDVWHHTVYALAAGVAYELLDGTVGNSRRHPEVTTDRAIE